MIQQNNKKPIILLLGPTASGKTAAAIGIAQQYPVALISVDSALVYRGMDIGTAKPSKDELQRYPHALIDICEPWQAYSAAQFRKDALFAIETAHAQDKVPLLVGGTMLYAKALLQGLSAAPSSDPLVREQLQQQLETHGSAYLHAQLQHVDHRAAQRIHPNDPQRILRALEVYQTTQKPLSDWWEQQEETFPYHPITLILAPNDRQVLHQRIEQRFKAMLAQGFVEEVKHLIQQPHMNADLPSMRSVGYRQVLEYLNGQYDYDTMVEKALAASRQLAKRQLTWLRAWPDAQWFESLDPPFWSSVKNTFIF